MTAIRSIGLTLLAATIAVSSASAQTRGSARLPTEDVLNRMGLTRLWSGHAVINPSRDRVKFVTLDNHNKLYVQSSNSVTTCFNAETGKRLWATRLGDPDQVIQQCSYSDDLCFCVHGNTCYAIRKETGDITWELALPGTPSVSPATDGKQLYVGMLDGSMYAFDYQKIAELSGKGLMPQWSFTTMVWRYSTSRPISTPAIPAGRLVAFASQNGSLYSVTSDDRRLVFQFETDARLSAPIVRHRDWLILSGEDFNVYALNIDNGKLGWQFAAGSDIRKAPVVIRDDVYILPERGGMFKLAGDTGIQAWWTGRAREFVAASPERIYVRGPAGELTALASRDGAVLATLPMDGFANQLRNIHNDRIVLCSSNGLVICLRELDLDFPAAHHDFDDKPIVPLIAPEGEQAAPPAKEPEM